MATQAAERLKKEFADMPAEYFEPLTFGELKIGEAFIVFPTPGDNSGHGGFKTKHWIFTKTQENVEKTERGLEYSKENPHGKAYNINHGNAEDDFPHSMLVILIE